MIVEIAQLRPDLFALRAHGKRWLKIIHYKPGRERAHGWRPVVWTDDFTEAEKFASRQDAQAFAEANVSGFRQNSQLTLAASTA